MQHTISNSQLKVSIFDKGSEVSSLKSVKLERNTCGMQTLLFGEAMLRFFSPLMVRLETMSAP